MAHFPTAWPQKDIILSIIGHIGIDGGNGAVVEYTGSAIRALSIEERMTVCNMSIEAGARAGMIAPDDTTYEYIAGKRFRTGRRRLWRSSWNAGKQTPDWRRRNLWPNATNSTQQTSHHR